MNHIRIYLSLLSFIIFIIACKKITEPLTPQAPSDDQLLDGPVAGLTGAQHQQFLLGDAAFNGQVFSSATGLGPYFVATSCGSCHAGDGKGHPFTTLTRFGQPDSSGNQFLLKGGPQLQNRALPGFTPEQIPSGTTFAKFTPPANTGLGFLAALTDAQLLANSDPNDVNADGISGRPNYVSAPTYFIPKSYHQSIAGRYIGRFGKKAAAVDLTHQTVNAYNQDMGITSVYSSNEPAIYGLSFPYFDNVPDPEVAATTVNDVVFYLKTLKAPIQRDQDNVEVLVGKQLFKTIRCAKCHTPEWTTPSTDIQALSNKTFYPYTDLLLHDMGSALDDGYTEGNALTSEWKTPPLWGLGLSKNSQGGQYYLLHDGRAKSIEEAILYHGGEAQNSKLKYQSLSESEKKTLIKFLESL